MWIVLRILRVVRKGEKWIDRVDWRKKWMKIEIDWKNIKELIENGLSNKIGKGRMDDEVIEDGKV